MSGIYNPGSAGGPASPVAFSSATVSLGSFPKTNGKAQITGLSGLSAGKPVLVWDGAGPLGALDDDKVIAHGVVLDATTIDVYWESKDIGVSGNRTFYYLVGA